VPGVFCLTCCRLPLHYLPLPAPACLPLWACYLPPWDSACVPACYLHTPCHYYMPPAMHRRACLLCRLGGWCLRKQHFCPACCLPPPYCLGPATCCLPLLDCLPGGFCNTCHTNHICYTCSIYLPPPAAPPHSARSPGRWEGRREDLLPARLLLHSYSACLCTCLCVVPGGGGCAPFTPPPAFRLPILCLGVLAGRDSLGWICHACLPPQPLMHISCLPASCTPYASWVCLPLPTLPAPGCLPAAPLSPPWFCYTSTTIGRMDGLGIYSPAHCLPTMPYLPAPPTSFLICSVPHLTTCILPACHTCTCRGGLAVCLPGGSYLGPLLPASLCLPGAFFVLLRLRPPACHLGGFWVPAWMPLPAVLPLLPACCRQVLSAVPSALSPATLLLDFLWAAGRFCVLPPFFCLPPAGCTHLPYHLLTFLHRFLCLLLATAFWVTLLCLLPGPCLHGLFTFYMPVFCRQPPHHSDSHQCSC